MTQNPGLASKPRKSPFFVSLVWGLIAFLLLLGLFEGLSRIEFISSHLGLPSVGSYHAQFELKWFALQDYVEKNQGVDVVVLGNSMVNTGIDPAIFEDTYATLSGERLRVFNFGVEGLTVEPLSVLANVINERYHPGTIILFTEMRDYIASNGTQTTQQFLDNPWMKYQMGTPSLEGYLLDHTSSFKYLLAWRNWSGATFLDDLNTKLYRKGSLTPEGYEPDRNPTVFDPTPPDKSDPSQKELFDLAANFQIAPSRVRNLQDILSLQSTGVQVIVTEMPLYPTYFDYFGPASVRSTYLNDLKTIIHQAGGEFVDSVPYDEIPISGRMDDHHLNQNGAPVFSRLLAQQFYKACEDQNKCIYPASTSREP